MRSRTVFSILILALVAAGGFLAGQLSDQQLPGVAAAPAMYPASTPQPPDDGKLRIIFFGAHPDDSEYRGAGVAKMWSDMGHHVKLVSTTNGDIGHWKMAGGPLALRRTEEVMEVGRQLGTTTQVLDIHDGEIMPTMENRRTIARLIRDWRADLVITNRPNDYHPDHRYTSILVQDAAYMVTVPFFTPNVPPLEKNPVFMYTADRFERPNPFRADVAVGIDEVMEETLDALMVMESQIHEGGANGHPGLYPEDDPAARERRSAEVRKRTASRYARAADQYRDTLIDFYGQETGSKFKYAQAFEICEYGSQPSREDLERLFPFFD